MKPWEIEERAPVDIWVVIEAYHHERNDDIRLQWETARAIAYNIHLHSWADKKARSTQAFWPFMWDKDPVGDTVRNRVLEAHKARKKELQNGS